MAEPIGAQLPYTGPNARWAANRRRPLVGQTRLKLMTVTEVSAELRMSRMTIYRMIHSGELFAVVTGKKTFRVPEAELARYLREGPRKDPVPLVTRRA